VGLVLQNTNQPSWILLEPTIGANNQTQSWTDLARDNSLAPTLYIEKLNHKSGKVTDKHAKSISKVGLISSP